MNPFDWKNSPKSIDWSDLNKSSRLSAQSSEIINRKRESGDEPGVIILTSKHLMRNPKHFAVKGKKSSDAK